MNPSKGKIHLVEVRNFVIYDSVTFIPGEYLNIITGANGTGKSTLVSAIVLGMGGSAKSLARMSNIKDYIKNGKDESSIHIEIYGKAVNEILHISRHFDVNGQDTFMVENKTVSKAAFLKVIAEFNIQVDNLCQFLPQDRVQDFTKMNPQELLHNTQISVCPPETAKALDMLKAKRIEQKNQGNNLQDSIAKLREHEQRNETLKAEIEAMRTRNKLVEKLDICDKKKAWMEFEELYIKFQEQKEDLEKANQNLEKHEAEMRPFQQQFEEIESVKVDFEQKIKQSLILSDKNMQNGIKLEEALFKLKEDITKAKGDFEFAMSSKTEQVNELQDALLIQQACMEDVKIAAETVGSAEEQKAIKANINQAMTQIKEETENLLEKRRKINKHLELSLKPQLINLSTTIKAIESVAERKLEVLRKRFDDAYRGVVWLRQNTHIFKGKVYEPIILEMTVKESKYAKYLENCIADRDLTAFTCECKEDMTLLHKKLRIELKLNANMLHSDPATSIKYRAPRDINQLRRYGFHSYLIDLIDAPAPILNALCRLYHIHIIPVGDEKTFEMTDDIPNDITNFFSVNHKFSITKSQYSDARSTMSKEIQSRNTLNVGVNMAMLNKQKEEHAKLLRESDNCKNEHIKIEDKIGTLENKNTDLIAQRRKIEKKFDHVKVCKEKLVRHLSKIERLKNNPIDLDVEKQKFNNTIRDIVGKSLEIQAKKVDAFGKYSEHFNENETLREKYSIFTKVNAEIENQLRDRREQVNKAKKFVDKIKDVNARTEKHCREKKQIAIKMTNGKTPSDPAKFPFAKEFGKLPALMEELQAHMNELQAQIDCLREGNESILEEYNTRISQIVVLQEAIDNFDQSNNRIEMEMQELHQQWHPIIMETITVINRNFSTFMGSMGFAGEVELIHNDVRDYAEYGIQIRVKYRNNEKLQALDRFLQSGGERAVAIAVYTLSLQQISNVPFRCVDEINQGMDPTNERKIFDMLVEQTSQLGKSQYFFVSPKLLQNFSYNALMKFHCVHNGIYTDDNALKTFVTDEIHKTMRAN